MILLPTSNNHVWKLEISVIESVYTVAQYMLIVMRASLQNVTLGMENLTGSITTEQVPVQVQEHLGVILYFLMILLFV